MKVLQLSGLLLALLCLCQPAIAQDAMSTDESVLTNDSAETPTAEKAEEVESKLPFDISGFVDLYYAYSATDNPLPTSFTEAVNSFNLGMANVKISKEGTVGFVADIAVGPRAETANGFSGTTLSAIKQLYVTYTPVEWLTFTLGNYGTHVGYELIDSPDNLNYSTSYLFSNGPFYHTGVKADIALSERFGLMVGLFDDTDNKFDIVPGKHIGGQLSYANGTTGLYLNYIGGRDESGEEGGVDIFGHQVDLTASFQANAQLGLGLNVSHKSIVPDEGDATSWYGAAVYANYAFSESFLLATRAEYLDDADAVLLGAQEGSVFSFTLSGNYKQGPLTFIPEFRLDTASDEIFPDGDDGKLTKQIPVFIVAAVYAF